jgi:hypothetical protein
MGDPPHLKFQAALNALPPQIVAQLPEGSADSSWNAMIYEQEQARASLQANQKDYCAQVMGADRLKHADALANGTMPFW